jgi:excinuclease ABC subunit A
MARHIVISGARVHNLKNIALEIPRDQLVVITGVSGSGKSSLAFDTLYAEGQRRYLESLSADARQFLRQIEKPDVDSIDGLSPAIAISQSSGFYTVRSTVGTVTEIYDYLRLLFARVGRPTCSVCGAEIAAFTIEQVADRLAALPEQSRLLVLAPIGPVDRESLRRRLSDLMRDGFARVKIGADLIDLASVNADAIPAQASVDLVVDRLTVRAGIEKRLWDSLETTARYGDQVIKIESQSAGERLQEMVFSLKLACANCGATLPEITPALFSFNSLHGACPACGGTGLANSGPKASEAALDDSPCRVCAGARLKKESLAIKLGQRNIAEVAAMSARQTLEFCRSLALGQREHVIGRRVLDEISSRLSFLIEVGLDYLSLDRPSLTLSAGESQRMRLATQIGTKLAGVLYILDEPSLGLHPRDNAQLLKLLKQLRNTGNSLLIVEHERETILQADHVIDMGPGAGAQGGQVVVQGSPAELQRDENSLTGRYLSGALAVRGPSPPRRGSGSFLVIQGAREHNLKNITVAIPIGAMTAITGVSGSGKSSLMIDTLYKRAAQRFYRARAIGGACDAILGWEHFDRVVAVDQSPIGRTPRSNPATYTGIFDHLRSLFAQLPEARLRGYGADRFSFNAKGGRCEACGGEGIIKVDMYFLPAVSVTCEVCKGQRYNRETLSVTYKGLSIADVLKFTVNEAAEMFSFMPAMFDRLRLLREVGLGYLTLGQPAAALSGGEAQRVKLARELARKSSGRTLYILDEPTAGLHFEDIRKLLEVLHRLVDEGNTMVIVAHAMEVVKTVDFVVDLGPEGGERGGYIVAQGTPAEIAQAAGSATGEYLRRVLYQITHLKPSKR